jgi:hypothetical protein
MNKNYLILRFDIYNKISKSKNKDKLNKIRWQYAEEYTKFQIELFDRFCSLTFKELSDKYFLYKENYKKNWVIGVYDIGWDMLQDELGLVREYQWSYHYFKIPINNIELIKFFKEYKFTFQVLEKQNI